MKYIFIPGMGIRLVEDYGLHGYIVASRYGVRNKVFVTRTQVTYHGITRLAMG